VPVRAIVYFGGQRAKTEGYQKPSLTGRKSRERAGKQKKTASIFQKQGTKPTQREGENQQALGLEETGNKPGDANSISHGSTQERRQR